MTTLKDFIAMAEELQEKDPETYETVAKIMGNTLGEIAEQERLREAAKKAASTGNHKDLSNHLSLRRQLRRQL